MLHTLGHDGDLACAELDVAVPKLDRQLPGEHEEDVAGVRVAVPTNSPSAFTTTTFSSLSRATMRGDHGSSKLARLSARSTLSCTYGAGRSMLSIWARCSLPE